MKPRSRLPSGDAADCLARAASLLGAAPPGRRPALVRHALAGRGTSEMRTRLRYDELRETLASLLARLGDPVRVAERLAPLAAYPTPIGLQVRLGRLADAPDETAMARTLVELLRSLADDPITEQPG